MLCPCGKESATTLKNLSSFCLLKTRYVSYLEESGIQENVVTCGSFLGLTLCRRRILNEQ